MDIYRAGKTLVCTCRVPGMKHSQFRILLNKNGAKVVATDAVGVREGNWVFTASGAAARHAAGDYGVLTYLTIAGIIDNWDESTS